MEGLRRKFVVASTFVVGVGVIAGVASLASRGAGRAVASEVVTPLKERYRRPERIPFPSSNPYSEEKYELGKKLFFDPRLSRSGTMSCASCHVPSLGWTDGRAKGLGDAHRELDRRVPTILNLAWSWAFFWDGRAASLEEQALGPIQAEAEMNMPLGALVERLGKIPGYVEAFDRAFPDAAISPDTIGKAIATFERTIVSDVAPFDRWIEGEEDAIPASAQRGFLLFNTTAGCVKCHTGWRLTNDSFADIGLDTTDLGRGKILGDAAVNFTFKTPTLRNVARRGPYMHDGRFRSLREIVDYYDGGGAVKRPMAQAFLKPLNLTEVEKEDLVAFLESLSSEDERVTPPELPREE